MKTITNYLKGLSWLSILLIIGITALFLYQLRKNARMETNLDEYMPKTHPAFLYSDQAEEWFNIKDGILIAIENPRGIYNPQTLRKIMEISDGLLQMGDFDETDIQSLYTADNITGNDDGLEVEPFYDTVPSDPGELTALRQKVRDNDMVAGRLVSADETVALVVAGMNSDHFTEELYHSVLEFAHSFGSDSDKVYVAGRPIVEGTMGQLGPADMKRMVPVVLVVIALVLYLLLRSVRATASILLTVFVSTIWAFGMMAIMDIPVYAVSTMIPVMLIAIGVAYGIYFFQYLNNFFAGSPETKITEALKKVTANLSKPLFMAAFTTIIGFISLLTSQVFPIKYFGIFTAFGIFVTFVLTLWLLPAMVILWGIRIRMPESGTGRVARWNASRITHQLLNSKKTIYITVTIIALLSLFGLGRVWINSSFLSNFESDSDIVLTDKFVNSRFGGTSTLNVILESEASDVFKNPEVLRLIDEMQIAAEDLQVVGNSFSLADYLKRMNRVMNSDSDESYTIPESSDMVAQYLLLYEMSGDPENLLRVINYDYNRTNITFQLKGDDSRTIKQALAVIRQFEQPFNDLGIRINYAGSGYKALVFTDLILEGQIRSIIMSLGLVLVLLTVMFRSTGAGLIGSVPIILTALISFGVMGLSGIALSTTTALLSSIAIGIGIDYAIHFLQHYRMNLATEVSKLEAIKKTMAQTGKAISFNAIVVIAGFLVLLFSVFPPNRTLGALVSMNMFTSFAGTLTLMMVLVYRFRVFSGKEESFEIQESK